MWIDIILAILITYGFYTGFEKGLIDTLFDTLSLILAILVALKLSPFVVDFLAKVLPLSSAVVFLLGFVLTFLLVMMIIRFIGNRVEDIFKFANVNVLNKAAGGVLRAFIYATVFAFVILFLGKINLVSPETTAKSRTYKLVEPFPRYAEAGFNKLKPIFSEFWEKTVEILDEVKESQKD